MKESISKVRTSVAYAISAIAHWDWPEAWPELFQILMEALTSGQPSSVHGAMRVLAGIMHMYLVLYCAFIFLRTCFVEALSAYSTCY